MPSPITTHVLDTSRGRPAVGIPVHLSKKLHHADADRWQILASAVTDADGRVGDFFADDPATPDHFGPGTYQLVFAVGDYLSSGGSSAFYSDIPIIFDVHDADEHYHVPLLLNPFGYSTYRGS